jgi:hypothetical protein
MTGLAMRENKGKKNVKNWPRVHNQVKCRNRVPGLFPLAAPNRRSGPHFSLLAQACGRIPGLLCKVHSGKGLPGRQGGVLGRLIWHQGPF